jgi:hypothetical protein
MTRVLSSACMILVLLGLGGRAWAGKPPIAILGLEVYDNGGGIDPETTKAAKELTAALRDRAKAGTGPFTPVQGEKELIDEKLLNNCDSEAATCMATIGSGLGAEVLLYGKIEKATQGGQAVYRVSIKLLNVTRKQLTASTVETLPVSDATGVRAQTYARTWYAKLAGAGSGGTLVIRANIDRGTVLVDDDAKGTLASGTLTLTGVGEGKHTLAVEGTREYQRYEAQITVRPGETTTQTVTMVPMPRKLAEMQPKETITREGTVTQPPPKGNVWRPVFYGAVVGTAAAGGFTLYEWVQQNRNAGKISTNGAFNTTVGTPVGGDPMMKQVRNDQCGSQAVSDFQGSHSDPADVADVKHFSDACNNVKYQKIGWVVTGVLGAATIGSFIMAYLRDSSPSEKVTDRGHRKHRQLVVTPIAAPDGGGATLRFDW